MTAGRPVMYVDLNEVKRLYGEGMSDRAIGAFLGCSGAIIGSRRRKLGLPAFRKGRRKDWRMGSPNVTRDHQIVAQNKAGLTYRTIGELHALSFTRIAQIVAKSRRNTSGRAAQVQDVTARRLGEDL